MKNLFKQSWFRIVVVVVVIILVLLSIQFIKQPEDTQNAQIANPASENCINNGGTLSIVNGVEGQVGMCTFPNGKVCEEWAYFRGECQK